MRICSYLSPHQRRGKASDIEAKQISTLTSCYYYGGESRIVCNDIAAIIDEKSIVPCVCTIVHCRTLGDSIKVPTSVVPLKWRHLLFDMKLAIRRLDSRQGAKHAKFRRKDKIILKKLLIIYFPIFAALASLREIFRVSFTGSAVPKRPLH